MTGECALRCEMRRMRLLPTTRHAAESTDSSIRTESFAATMVLDVWNAGVGREFEENRGADAERGGRNSAVARVGTFPSLQNTPCHIARPSHTHSFRPPFHLLAFSLTHCPGSTIPAHS